MDLNSIDAELDKMIQQAEKDIDVVFAKRLKVIQNHLAEMFRKYSKGGELSRTELYKYNRFEKEMEFIKQNINSDYQQIHKEIHGLMQSQWLENYLKSSYLFELTAQAHMEYHMPSMATVNAAIVNPIKELTLPKLLQKHRNEIIRNIRIIIAQGIQGGQDYATVAREIEDKFNFSAYKARRIARTESGRVATTSRLKSMEIAAKHANIKKIWLSSHDMRVRHAHRVLDGQEADENGFFHYRGHKAKGPHLFGIAKQDCNCRCNLIASVNGKKPDSMRVRNPDGSTEVVKYQPYKEWVKTLPNGA